MNLISAVFSFGIRDVQKSDGRCSLTLNLNKRLSHVECYSSKASSKVSQRNGYKTLNYMNSLPNRTGPSIQRGVSQITTNRTTVLS